MSDMFSLSGGESTYDGTIDRSPMFEEEAAGFEPSGHLVLTLPDQIPEFSAGGIALPGDTVEREYLGQIFVKVVALGTNCWYDEPNPRAKIGDRVMIARYTGQLFKGSDGKRYRLVNDKDVLGVVTGDNVKI